MKDAYQLAQRAVADLKAAVYAILAEAPSEGFTNAEMGVASASTPGTSNVKVTSRTPPWP